MKFVLYYRVSTNRQDYGIDAQKEAVSRYLATLPAQYEVLGAFEEKESGKDSENRPQLQAALALAQAKGARLCIAKLCRLSRNAAFLLTLQNSGVDFVCCDMPNADRMTIGIMALVAQRERELISERTKAGLAVAKARGVRLGGPAGPSRVKSLASAAKAIQDRKKAFAESVAKHIRDIERSGATSLYKIRDYLELRGVKTARGKTRWTITAVRRAKEAAAS